MKMQHLLVKKTTMEKHFIPRLFYHHLLSFIGFTLNKNRQYH